MLRKHGGRINEVARELYPSFGIAQNIDQHPNLNRMLIVRHPFHRLVSAYRDKLERLAGMSPQRDYYYGLYGKKIYSRYRARAMEKFGNKFFSVENNFGTPVSPTLKHKRSAVNPIFWEFIQFVRDAKSVFSMDMHWQPASTWCSVCSLNFTHVLKFESIGEEEELFHEANNMTNVIQRKWLNPNHPSQLDPDSLVKLYFEQLSDEDVLALYKIYETDFRMFDYTFSYRNFTFPFEQ